MYHWDICEFVLLSCFPDQSRNLKVTFKLEFLSFDPGTVSVISTATLSFPDCNIALSLVPLSHFSLALESFSFNPFNSDSCFVFNSLNCFSKSFSPFHSFQFLPDPFLIKQGVVELHQLEVRSDPVNIPPALPPFPSRFLVSLRHERGSYQSV